MSEPEAENSNSADAAQRAQPHAPSPGRLLSRRRESQGLSQAEVAESLHLTVHYINALENDNYKKLPGRTFVKGYFKSYAKLLQMDVDEVVESFENHVAAQDASQQTEIQETRKRKAADQNLRWLMCAAFIIVIVVAFAWWFGHDNPGDEVTVNMASQPPGQAEDIAPVAPRGDTAEELMAEAGAGPGPAEPEPVAARAADAPASADPNAASNGLVPEQPGRGAEPAASDGVETGEPGASPPEGAVAGARIDALEQAAGEAAPGLPDYDVEADEDGRQFTLEVPGEDSLVMRLSGTSWIEVDDGRDMRLFNDNLHDGDELNIRGEAPFNILMGNAPAVGIVFNTEPVNLAPRIQSDNTARILLEP